jgi:amino acid adenylation domain-containing protein
MHNIALDRWSFSIIVKEAVELYAAYLENREAILPPLLIQYADYAMWQRNYLQGELLDRKLGYWKNKLSGVSALQLPTDHQRPAVWSTRGALAQFTIEKKLSEQIQQLSQQQGATLFMTLLAAFKVLLHRYSGQQDICVGSPIANRTQQEVEGLIGLFVNTLALRSEVNGETPFTDFLQEVRDMMMEAYEQQDVPFEKVVASVIKERDLSRNPLFQVMLILQNAPDVQELRLQDVTLSIQEYEHTTTQFDITYNIIWTNDGLEITVEYATDLFNDSTIVRMMDHFRELLSSIIKNPQQKIGELQMLTNEEEHQLLVEFNDTKVDYPKDRTIVNLFEDQAAKTPGATAVIFEDEQLTYQQLNERANQLAHYLRSKGVEQETLVPICIERSLEMIVGILGVLKAGGAYVPVDPEYPEERISYMLEDTGASVIITSKESKSKLKTSQSIELIELDSDWFMLNGQLSSTNYQLSTPNPHHLTYVIYTSGSTGKPKGVMIENRSVINLIKSITDKVDFQSDSIFLAVTTFSFDISYLEFYMPLINGGRLIIASRDIATDGFKLAKCISQNYPTHMQATPATWQLLLDSDWTNKEAIKILIGGEAVKEEIKEQLTKKGIVFNLYGPTETTIWSTIKKLESNQKVLIGKPLSNTIIQIVNKKGDLVPVGVAGEICIGGIGVARGYFNLPDLTAEKFIKNRYSNNAGSRIYKTGDVGRWSADGNIECLGRIDDQVKIRGYRIELGEIETVLQQCEGVSQGVVLARTVTKVTSNW